VPPQTPIGGQPLQSILRTRSTTATSEPGDTEIGGLLAVTTRRLGKSCRRCLSAAVFRTYHEAATEVVRGGSPWARWWTVTLEVINELGGGRESDQRELESDDHRARRSLCLDPEGTAPCLLGQASCRDEVIAILGRDYCKPFPANSNATRASARTGRWCASLSSDEFRRRGQSYSQLPRKSTQSGPSGPAREEVRNV
jgi:hypothetical protein